MFVLYCLLYQPKASAKVYYFLLISPEREASFLMAQHGTTPFNLKAYGTIVASGYGHPPEHLENELREKYASLLCNQSSNG